MAAGSEAQLDAFVSYARADRTWVRALAENLLRLGIRLFFDEYDIRPGDVLVPALESDICQTRHGLLVVSRASVTRPWADEEYAAIMTPTMEGQQRLLPVLLEEVDLPPFVASCPWFDRSAATTRAR